MATFSAQITDLIGGTIDQDACDQWALDGTREIITKLPASLQEKCSNFSILDDSPTTLDLDTVTVGKVLYCTRYNGTYHKNCRLVASSNASLVDDSTATNFYAVADDPAYFIRDNILEIKPTPDATYIGRVYHLLYPSSIDVSAVSSLDDFPIEAEYLIILYVASKQLQQYMNSMNAFLIHSDQDGSYSSSSTSSQGWERVRALIEDEDIDLSSASLAALGGEMQQFVTEYSWYADQYAKLQAQYIAGLDALKGA